MITIRKRRRDRTHSRIANQKRLDAIAYTEINKHIWANADTWGGTHCPDCAKPLPSRAFFCGYHTGNSHVRISVGSSVSFNFCHADKTRCYSESAKTDPHIWKLANDYIATKKELKQLEKKRECRKKRAKEALEKNHVIHTAKT